MFCVHTDADAHEHEPHWHEALHVWVPYVLHVCVLFGEHPWPAHMPLGCHAPVALHVWVSVPQLPHSTGFVCPGPHTPAQAPAVQVWLDPHAAPVFCQCPVPSHVCGCWPLQLV